ncbi:MAG: hypothetical protein JXA87_08555 [Thermoleophilia bacterium]|nr:hypothetical protein [Thermoleophilia bacterium]
MSETSHTPIPDGGMNASIRQNRSPGDPGPARGPAGAAASARLQAIHDLIRSGDYHVPATAIADRIIEQLLAGKPRRPI